MIGRIGEARVQLVSGLEKSFTCRENADRCGRNGPRAERRCVGEAAGGTAVVFGERDQKSVSGLAANRTKMRVTALLKARGCDCSRRETK